MMLNNPQEHREVVEVYRPEYKKTVTSPIITAKRRSRNGKWSWKAGVGLALLSAGLYATYGQPQASLVTVQRQLNWLSSTVRRLTSVGKLLSRASDGRLWTLVALCSAVQILVSVSAVSWLWTKLDVQPDQTGYPAYRPFRREKALRRKHVTQAEDVLHPVDYRKFPLASKIQVSHNVYRLVFSLPKLGSCLGLPAGQHIAVRADVQGESISRSYTPISSGSVEGHFELLVKVYPQGKLTSGFLQDLEPGDKLDVRGPIGMLKYHKTLAKHLLMIAGGTGITPMYQIIQKIVADQEDETVISLLYANNDENDILLREELDAIAARWPKKVQLRYVLLNAPPEFQGGTGYVTQEVIQRFGPSGREGVKVLVCGPPPMVEAQKKNLHNMGYSLPGSLAKPSDEVYLF